jgi:DNA repair exonuclease SbcCD ATPase subunit
MIQFKSVRWKNFLSTGNAFSEIRLDASPATLIVGTNGAGKSTFLDAMCFALFNKPFRKITKGQLVNAVNERDLLVEIEFSIGSRDYMIRRGAKPNVFEIYLNGEMLNQEASVQEQQKHLEQSILRLNYKSFTQVVILGSSCFVPFMQLTPPNRREVIEDLLDIRIFSTMNTLLKEKVKGVKETLRECDYQYELVKQKVQMQQRFIADLKEQSSANNARRSKDIESLEDEITFLMTDVAEGLEVSASHDKSLDSYGNVEEELSQLRLFESRFDDKKKAFKKEFKFFDKNDSCPTCKSVITEDVRANKKAEITASIDEIDEASIALQKKLKSIVQQVSDKHIVMSDLMEVQQKISNCNKEIQWKKKEIKKIEDKIKNADNNNLTREKEKLQEIASTGMEVEKELSTNRKVRNNYDTVTNMLRDTGIKAGIIKRYLPVMNQLINRYLKELDFYVSFDLDENFEETIKSRFRDEFSYASFSEGEKMRIDLALLFTWRTIAKMKNSANTNLLILDEIFDSSLDVSGTDDFLKILHTVADNTNVFVISHKTETLQDKFSSTLVVEKKQNFSIITKEE